MAKKILLPILLLLTASCHGVRSQGDFSDAPRPNLVSIAELTAAASYEHALQVWKTPEDVNAWIAANFAYDIQRSVRFSETQVKQQGPLPIYPPAEFFVIKSGGCVDLSRFAVETLRAINPQYAATYLMVEFDPIYISGNLLRRHWLASFKREGKTYFFADSKRPGLINGPYNDTEEFIREYARFRTRKIVTFREVESYQKQYRPRSLK